VGANPSLSQEGILTTRKGSIRVFQLQEQGKEALFFAVTPDSWYSSLTEASDPVMVSSRVVEAWPRRGRLNLTVGSEVRDKRIKSKKQLGVMVHAYNLSTWET
jgi:hypothetical protein